MNGMAIFVDDYDPCRFRALIEQLENDAKLISFGSSCNKIQTHNQRHFDSFLRKIKVYRHNYQQQQQPPLFSTSKTQDEMKSLWYGIVQGLPQLENLELYNFDGNDLRNALILSFVNENIGGTSITHNGNFYFSCCSPSYDNLRTISITMANNNNDNQEAIVDNIVLEVLAGTTIISTRLIIPRLKSVTIEAAIVKEADNSDDGDLTDEDIADRNNNNNDGILTSRIHSSSIEILLKSTTLEKITIRNPYRIMRRHHQSRHDNDNQNNNRMDGIIDTINNNATALLHQQKMEDVRRKVLLSFCQSLSLKSSNLLLSSLDLEYDLCEEAIGFVADAIRSNRMSNLKSLAISFYYKHDTSNFNDSGSDKTVTYSTTKTDRVIEILCNALRYNTTLLHVRNHKAKKVLKVIPTKNKLHITTASIMLSASKRNILTLLEDFNFRLRALDLCCDDDDDDNNNNRNRYPDNNQSNVNKNDQQSAISSLHVPSFKERKDFFLKLNFWGRDKFLREHNNNNNEGKIKDYCWIDDLFSLIGNDLDCIYYFVSKNPSLCSLHKVEHTKTKKFSSLLSSDITTNNCEDVGVGEKRYSVAGADKSRPTKRRRI
jgi:DNA-binding Xre family transcriptional regulator